MATTPYPLPRETRETTMLVGNGTPGPYGPSQFKVFDTIDVEVWARADGETAFTQRSVAVAKTNNLDLDTVSVTFEDDIPDTTEFFIVSRRIHERMLAITRAGALDAAQLEKELSKQASVLQELRRDINRGGSQVPGEDGQTLVFQDRKVVPGMAQVDMKQFQENTELAAEAAAQHRDEAEAAAGVATAAADVATGAASVATVAADAATGAMSAIVLAENTFATKATAEAFSPVAAPDYIRTAGCLAAGDGGGALLKKNGATTGYLVITLDDGTTDVGYDLAEQLCDIKMFGPAGDGATDDLAAFQAAYDTLPDMSRLRVSAGPVRYKLSANVTLSGTKRIYYDVDPDVLFDAADTFSKICGGEVAHSGVGQFWHGQEHFTDYRPTHGGLRYISGHRPQTNSADGYAWEMYRSELTNADPSSGPAWDGVGATNKNRFVVNASWYNHVATGNLYASACTINPYLHFMTGSDGQGSAIEANTHLSEISQAVKEISLTKVKRAFLAANKDPLYPGTVAFQYNGYYKGLAALQAHLPNDPETRFIELTNLFEVMRDGRLVVGKGGTNLFTAGSELGPSGDMYLTGNANTALLYGARNDNMAGQAAVLSIQGRALSSTGVQRVFGQIDFNCIDGSNGAEFGRTTINTIASGTATIRGYFQSGFVVGSPTGADKGAGTINATAVYDDNVVLTCYVLEYWLTGEIDLDFWDSMVPNRQHPEVRQTVEIGTNDSGAPVYEERVVEEAWEEERKHGRAASFRAVAAERLDLDKYVEYMRTRRKLPAFPGPEGWADGSLATGELIQRLWETVEVQAVHIAQLHERLKAVEAHQAA